MHDLQASDLNDVLAVGRMATECNSLDELQNDPLKKMQDALGAATCVYMSMYTDGRHIRFKGDKAHDHPASCMNSWCEQYQPMDPFVRQLMRQYKTDGANIIRSNEVVLEAEFQASRFYNDFLRPMSIYHVMVVGLSYGGKPFGILGFHRPQHKPAFSEKQATKAALMTPYLAAAIQKSRIVEQVEEREWLIERLASDLPYDSVIILDQTLTPIFTSQNAKHLLKTEHLYDQKQILPPLLVEKCKHLKNAISKNLSTEGLHSFSISLNHLHKQIPVRLRAMDSGSSGLRIMICLQQTDAPSVDQDRIKQLGLTTRQADIAQLVGVGMTNADIAEKLCISIRTVENHLRTIYEKADVHNRTSLVYRLAH